MVRGKCKMSLRWSFYGVVVVSRAAQGETCNVGPPSLFPFGTLHNKKYVH